MCRIDRIGTIDRNPNKENVDDNNRIDIISQNLEKYNGKICDRRLIERLFPEESLTIRIDGKYIIRHIDIISYTSATIINPKKVNYNTQDNSMPTSIAALLEDKNFSMHLLMTEPLSKAAQEAYSSQKLGNAHWENNVNASTSAFEDAYMTLLETYQNENIFSKRLKDNHLEVYMTSIALPYAIFKVTYKDAYEELDYIKVDLYSPYMEQDNKNRRSFVISKKHDQQNYEFFSTQVRSIIGGHATRRLTLNQQKPICHKVYLIKNDKIENAFKTQSRQYFSGKVQFGRGNLKNKISFIETGMSSYGNHRAVFNDVPHFHFTTAEHYIILEGEQKIIDLDHHIQYKAKKGDFVFIPPFTKHITKNKQGTKIFFAKSPEYISGTENNIDKCEVNFTEDEKTKIKEWCLSYDINLIDLE